MALNHNLRFGNWSSSEIGYLCTSDKKGGFGKPAETYIQKKKFEYRLGQRIDVESSAKPLTYGKLVEQWVFSKMGISWQITSDETLPHPTMPFWVGSKDVIEITNEIRTVGDIKSPYTKKSYCELSEICIENDLQKFKDEYSLYFYQLVSNAIINNCQRATLIIGMPYKDELPEIRELANNSTEEDKFQYYWISAAHDNMLPHLIRDTYYKNLYTLNFEVPKEDIDFLTERVELANKIRQNWDVPENQK